MLQFAFVKVVCFACVTLGSTGISCRSPSIRLFVCLSQVGVLLKQLNVGSRKQHHTIAQGL